MGSKTNQWGHVPVSYNWHYARLLPVSSRIVPLRRSQIINKDSIVLAVSEQE